MDRKRLGRLIRQRMAANPDCVITYVFTPNATFGDIIRMLDRLRLYGVRKFAHRPMSDEEMSAWQEKRQDGEADVISASESAAPVSR
ncbi:MAG: hypothetical protein AAF206_15695 [Bacteroidota bacterium]